MEPQNPYSGQSQQPNQYNPSFGQTPVSPPPIQQNFQSPPPSPSPLPHNSVPPIRHTGLGDKLEQIIMLCYFFVAALLTFRFALGLFGARQSPFVEFVRDISIPFMIPFEGMFGTTPTAGYYSLEFESLVAIMVYAGIFFGLARLVKIIFR